MVTTFAGKRPRTARTTVASAPDRRGGPAASNRLFIGGVLGALLGSAALGGCSTPPAKNFGGAWHPANTLPERPTKIPLKVAYAFYAAPTDGTLKAMLARWARDTKRDLIYQAAFDVTLYTPVSSIRTTDINSAAVALSRMYASQNIVVTATTHSIIVGAAGGTAPGTASRASAIPASPAGTRTGHPQAAQP